MANDPVIVVGAGMAGLTIADELGRRGRPVTVLEARDRVGGRCHTVDGVDLGAHWIHGTEGNPVTALARRFGLPTVFVGGDSTFTGGWDALDLRNDGAPADDETKWTSLLAADAMWDALEVERRRRLESGAPDVSLRDAVDDLRRQGLVAPATDALDWHLELVARDDAGCGSDELSLLAHDEGVDVYGYGDSVLAAGYGALAAHLATGVDVRRSSPVTRIDARNPDQVTVVTPTETWSASAVVVTVPLGVLKRGAIEFLPPLPARKRTAIERLGVGTLAKAVLRFDDVWWPEQQYVFGVGANGVTNWPTVLINGWATHHQPVLVTLAGGALGRWIESAPVVALRDWSVDLLHTVFGRVASTPTEVERTQWSLDPYSLGSYSAMTVGASAEDVEALAAPVGRVGFAGEATSANAWGTVHGAVTSGLREAARLTGDPSIAADRFIAETRRWRRQQQRVIRFHNSVSNRLGAEDLAERLVVLRRNPAFDDVPRRDLEALASMLDERDVAVGERLCTAGEAATEVFVLAAGDAVVVLPDGSRVGTMSVGHIIGELGLFTRHERTADVVATAPTTLLALDYERFRRFLLAFPEAALAILGRSIEQLVNDRRSH